MLRKTIRWVLVASALAAPLLSACIDLHEAEDCNLTLTCPFDGGPDADAAGDGS